jgi:hypothetical protein
MGWFRSNRGGVAWLALFALAYQLMLSLSHFHASKFDARSLAFAALETGDAAAPGPPSPLQKKSNGLAVDFCAICANISLASTLILPVLAIILALRLFAGIFSWPLTASHPASPNHLPFSARGPPRRVT